MKNMFFQERRHPHIHYGVFSPIEQASKRELSFCCNRRSHYNNVNDKHMQKKNHINKKL